MEECTWEPEEHLESCRGLLELFEAKNKRILVGPEYSHTEDDMD